MLLSHLAARLYGTPLLIARPKLDVILSVLGSRIGLHHQGLPDLGMALPAPRQSVSSAQTGIAVIPVVGTLVKRAMGIEAASGLMSYDEIDDRLECESEFLVLDRRAQLARLTQGDAHRLIQRFGEILRLEKYLIAFAGNLH